MKADICRNYAGACGVLAVKNFGYLGGIEITRENLNSRQSVGIIEAGFIKDDINSDEMFKILSEIATPVYISPVRKNPNSGRMFYFAVFDMRDLE